MGEIGQKKVFFKRLETVGKEAWAVDKKRAFNPGDTVTTFTGQAGVVISQDVLAGARDRLKEGRRPGYYFAPGCCHHPDYIIQIPVIFEDGTYDVMRAMNLKRTPDISGEITSRLEGLIEELRASGAARSE